jgi:transposase
MKSKTQRIRTINEKTLVVTLDIGKKVHYGYFRAPKGKDIKPFRIHNSRKSFRKFWAKVLKFKRQQGLEDIVVGFESTGPYAEPLFHYLKNKPVKLVQINPMHSKRLKDLTGNSPNKTDNKDPRVIADVICLGHALTVVIPEGAAAHLRRLTQARERAMKNYISTLNQLQNLVFLIFPELCRILNPSTKSALYLIKKHTTPESIYAMGVKSLTEVLRKISRGKIGRERAKQLFQAAHHSIGIYEGKESILLEIDHLVSKMEGENQFIKSLEKKMASYLSRVPYSGSLLSIKGLGVITVAGLIGEVGDFRKFRTISEVIKLAGLDLYEVSSGQHKGKRRISKRGRSLMRKLLYFAALQAVRSNGILHEPYEQMLERGMPKVKALIAISRKLLRVIFAIARDNTEYVNNYNQTHHYKLAA